MNTVVPVEFYNTRKAEVEHHPIVKNVGELVEQLGRLPKDLSVNSGGSVGAEMIVYNMDKNGSYSYAHLELEEVWFEEDEDEDDD